MTDKAIFKINSDVENAFRWSSKNGLKLIVGKYSVFHLSSHNVVQTFSDVMLRSESLSEWASVKTIGISVVLI